MHASAYIRDAVEYIAAAQAIDDEVGSDDGFEVLSPKAAYYLTCHGLELATKAVLIHAGWTERQLRDVSHDLPQCVAAAIKSGMKLQLTADEERLVGLLNKAYRRFRYPESGEIELPVWGPLTDIVIKVIKASIDAVPKSNEAIRPDALDRLTGFVSWHA